MTRVRSARGRPQDQAPTAGSKFAFRRNGLMGSFHTYSSGADHVSGGCGLRVSVTSRTGVWEGTDRPRAAYPIAATARSPDSRSATRSALARSDRAQAVVKKGFMSFPGRLETQCGTELPEDYPEIMT